MGYRFSDNPPKPEDHLRRFTVRNGTIMRLAFGCFYLYGHNNKYHDHIGWPNPSSPDHICQDTSNMRLYPFKNKTVSFDEIHLTEEGYDEAVVAYEDDENLQYLETTAFIDNDNDSVVRMNVAANLPSFEDKPVDLRFTLFVKKEDGSAIDAVCHGIVTVLPGAPYPTGE